MATTPPTKSARDKNLTDLKLAATTWFDKEMRRLDNESKFLRAVLIGRGINESVIQNLTALHPVVVSEITDFLTAK